MKFQEPGAPPGGSANAALPGPANWLAALFGFVDKTFVIAELEVRKLRHDATELITRAIQPALWLLVFGQVFSRARIIPTGDIPYLDFMSPGILAQSVLFIAIFYGIAIIACWVKTRERFMGIGQVLTMPLFFASNAIYPISLMPGWLKVVAHANPLSYEVDALRSLMLAQGTSVFGLGLDYGILLASTAILVILGAIIYPNVVR